MTSAEDDLPLRPVAPDRYVDFQMAGDGSMGLVYYAVDTELKRNVAFKIVRSDRRGPKPETPLDASVPKRDAHFQELRARFLQEAWVTGGMEHPGIVPVYELGRTETGVPYYTMRFIPGQRTLKTAIDELKGRPFEERVGVLEPFLKLCDAVSYAHARGVIHRDVKPLNVALGEFGEVVLLDWGLAKLVREDESIPVRAEAVLPTERDFDTGDAGLGTPGYMPPEAIGGGVKGLDERGDVYSLGVILFQMLTDRLPFRLVPFQEYLDKALNQDPPVARSLNPDVPPALERLCAQALCRNREDRLPSVRALSDGVRDWRTQTALEREMQGLVRDAEGALAAAHLAKGPSRIRQSQRALEVLAEARKRDAESPHLRDLATQARGLQNRGIKEAQKVSRQRLVLVGGVILFALLAVVGIVVSRHLDEQRAELKKANLELNDSRAEAEEQSRLASKAEQESQRKAQEARDAFELFKLMIGQVSSAEGEGTEQLTGVLATGLSKAVDQENSDGLLLLLEQIRETDPLTRLALGKTTRGVVFPPARQAAEIEARRRTVQAQEAERAVRQGSFKQQRAARRALRQARIEHAALIREGLTALADGLEPALPAPPTSEQIQASLRPGDVFVAYAHVESAVVAVVLQKESKQFLTLGSAQPIAASIASYREALGERRGTAEFLRLMREQLVDPLPVPAASGRIVFVPQGAMLFVPFARLLPSLDVCIVPSAGAWLHLQGLAPEVGDGVLAVANPTGPRRLVLPGARAEAAAVGDATLLGADLTWKNLAEALRTRRHWRAVHLGQSGLIADGRSRAAYLEVTPTQDEDGALGAFEVARLGGSADLAVLSAASLNVAPEELRGVTLDLPQALLFAGARRVLFATMPLDDEATQALMIRFYELWQAEGGPGPLAALRQAQAYVRTFEVEQVDPVASQRQQRRVTRKVRPWEHPYYWAAWTLWGLPD